MLPDGLSAFPITPFDADGAVDTTALRRLVARLRDAEVDSIGVLGSTGSYAYLTRAERRRALDAALDESGDRVPVLAGVGALRTDEAVRLAEDARAAGATAGLLAPMSYTPLTDDEVYAHYRTVAEESGLPICIYDNPGTTHFAFSPALVARLAALDGIVAVKSPSTAAVSDHLADLRSRVPAGFSLGYSGDWNMTEAMIAGADTWYGVFPGLFPSPVQAIIRAAKTGDAAEARRLNAELEPVWNLFRTHTSLRVTYAFANALGITVAQPARPVLPLPDEVQAEARPVMEACGLT